MTEATPSRMAQTAVVQNAVSKILALRKLARESGCITTRTQSKILQALSEHELTAVAEILAKQPEDSRG